jgi:predicted PurR-regulated permease PerM
LPKGDDWVRATLWIYAGLVFAAALLLALFWRPLAAVGKILLAAALLAAVLSPAQKRLERRMKRGVAAFLCILVLLGTVAVIVMLCAPVLARQFGELKTTLPQLLAQAQQWIETVNALLDGVGLGIQLNWDGFGAAVGAQLGAWTGQAVSIAADVGQYLLAPVIAFYLLRDRAGLNDCVLRVLPPAWRAGWERFFYDFSTAFGDYLRAQLLICAFTGAATALLLAVIGLDAALLLGLLMAIFNIIPYFGPILGAVPIVLAAMPGGMGQVLWALAAVVAVQQIESMAITPRLMGHFCGFHPAVVMLLILFAAGAFGLWGMLLAVPAATLVRCACRSCVFEKIYGKNV